MPLFWPSIPGTWSLWSWIGVLWKFVSFWKFTIFRILKLDLYQLYFGLERNFFSNILHKKVKLGADLKNEKCANFKIRLKSTIFGADMKRFNKCHYRRNFPVIENFLKIFRNLNRFYLFFYDAKWGWRGTENVTSLKFLILYNSNRIVFGVFGKIVEKKYFLFFRKIMEIYDSRQIINENVLHIYKLTSIL